MRKNLSDYLYEDAGTFYTDPLDLATMENINAVEVLAHVVSITGTNAAVTVTPQFGFNGTTWYDGTAMTAIVAAGSATQAVAAGKIGTKMRLKVVVAVDSGEVEASCIFCISAR